MAATLSSPSIAKCYGATAAMGYQWQLSNDGLASQLRRQREPRYCSKFGNKNKRDSHATDRGSFRSYPR